jgi:hypothetical protein
MDAISVQGIEWRYGLGLRLQTPEKCCRVAVSHLDNLLTTNPGRE